MMFPSGEELSVSVRTRRPADGAISSLSIELKKFDCHLYPARAAGVFSCASSSSRLPTFGFSGTGGMRQKKFLTRGSRRRSASIFEGVLGVTVVPVWSGMIDSFCFASKLVVFGAAQRMTRTRPVAMQMSLRFDCETKCVVEPVEDASIREPVGAALAVCSCAFCGGEVDHRFWAG